MIRELYLYLGEDTDPRRNLAIEEYLTSSVPQGACTLYLWQNRHTVVIGQNQNAWKECRTDALQRDGGILVRRLSGGGAVYHDLGNLNFTFCLCEEDYDLHRQQSVLLEACRLLGIEAELSGRNDLTASGGKFSGNSFYHHAGKAFHNGTLLIDVDMENLSRYLSPSKAKIESKGVASVRSRVINLKELCPDLTVEKMVAAMKQAFSAVYGLPVKELKSADFDKDFLKESTARFSDYSWTYGKSLPFDFSCTEKYPWGEVTVSFGVQGGKCKNAAVYSDAMETDFVLPLTQALEGCDFTADAICKAIFRVPECAPYAQDLCALILAQNI